MSKWRTQPISPKCEVASRVITDQCQQPTAAAYPAMGGGWMALCTRHAKKHPEATPIKKLLESGETLAP